jgi:hypothetical protein
MKTVITGVLASVLLAALPAQAQAQIQQQQVQFKKGESGATIKGSLKGEQIIDYKLRAGAGQAMVVQFKPSNPSAYFNVLPPGSSEAIHIGSTAGNEFSTDLKASGEYTIRVYLMRNAARRNESVKYTLDIGVSGDVKKSSVPAAATTAAASNAGPSRWDASGNIPCSAGSDKFDQQCGFRVVRDLPRKAASIWIANVANGQADYRYLRYADKAFTGNDQAKLAWRRVDDNWWLSVDAREFYFIPDALIHGG